MFQKGIQKKGVFNIAIMYWLKNREGIGKDDKICIPWLLNMN